MVPDDEDYRDLAGLLAVPRSCHPEDVRRRAQMAAVADDIEAAVRDFDSSR